LATAPAGAVQAIPPINSGAFCDEMAEFTDNDLLKKQCLEDEAKASRDVASRWAALPDRVRSECLKNLALETPSYQGLISCVDGLLNMRWREGKGKEPPQ
jgi:hypothetical protein